MIPIIDFSFLEDILSQVRRPARYIGGEWNAARNSSRENVFRVALAFPDLYEVGMSYLGFKLFYWLLNEMPDVVAERVYTPWIDMEREMKAAGLPLYSLESFIPLKEFDLIAFTLPHELSYTNILTMLDLGGIPLHSSDRGPVDPIIIAGGYGAFSPEPLAHFIDGFFIGEGEEGFPEIVNLLKKLKIQGMSRDERINALSREAGMYVPRFYQAEYTDGGNLAGIFPAVDHVSSRVTRRTVKDLNQVFHNRTDLVPCMDTVHNRAAVEIMRGCTRGCRFCNAGMLFRPVRKRSAENVCSIARDIIKNTGYEELALCSLSTTDHSESERIITDLKKDFDPAHISLSLSSLRADMFSIDLAQMVGQVRRTGLTFAPEAGSQRLRDVINKGVTEEDLLDTVARIARQGWQKVKLYFMIGLPGERQEDIEAIVHLVKAVRREGRKYSSKGFRINLSVSPFCPKPHTPFQWVGQESRELFKKKLQFLRKNLRIKGVKFNYSESDAAWLEAVIARGDSRVGRVIERAWLNGARMDNWTECFDPLVWETAFTEEGIDPEFFSTRERLPDEVFPWHYIDAGVTRSWLWNEYQRALSGVTTPDCRRGHCSQCGAC